MIDLFSSFSTDFFLVLPEVGLAAAILGLLLYGVFEGKRGDLGMKGALGLVLLLLLLVQVLTDGGRHTSWQELYAIDTFTTYSKALLVLTVGVIWITCEHFPRVPELQQPEYGLLWLCALLGMMIMISAEDLMTLFLGMELQSLSLYIIVAMRRSAYPTIESGLKYFFLGALATGISLYGMSLIYGHTGSTQFGTLAQVLGGKESLPPLVGVGLAFVLCGLAFKLALVPFHMWAPAVYQESPTLTTLFLAVAPKITAGFVLIRLLCGPFGELTEQWQMLLAGLSMMSTFFMAIAGLYALNLQRLIAFSGMSHMGYAIMGLIPGTEAAVSNMILYLIIYLITLCGVFFVLMSLNTDRSSVTMVADLRGLAQERPKTAFLFSLLLISLAGIPPCAGFFAKFLVFLSAIEAGYYEVACVGVLGSVIAAFYYLRLIKMMYFEQAKSPASVPAEGVVGGLPAAGRGGALRLDARLQTMSLLIAGFSVLFLLGSNPFFQLCKVMSTSVCGS